QADHVFREPFRDRLRLDLGDETVLVIAGGEFFDRLGLRGHGSPAYEPRTVDACGSSALPNANRGSGLLISASVTLASACRTTRLIPFQLSVTGQNVSWGHRRPCGSLHWVSEI